jgi:hypothetical protein
MRYRERLPLLDDLGKALIEDVRDFYLSYFYKILDGDNAKAQAEYLSLDKMTDLQREAVKNLMADCADCMVAEFLRVIDAPYKGSRFDLLIEKDGEVYSYRDLTEEPGSEIADYDPETGWIQRFSKIQRGDFAKK